MLKQNTLYLTTPGSYVSRDHLSLKVEIEQQTKVLLPIHHLESICVFGPTIYITPQALRLCWEHGVSVNYFSEHGYFIGRWEGVATGSVGLRRAQYRAADDAKRATGIARQCVAGKLQNLRQSLLRSARENESAEESGQLSAVAEQIKGILRRLEHADSLDVIRGFEGQAANLYFSVFSLHLRQRREDFAFKTRTRRPALDRINCLLSFLYALLRHDVIAALTATGLDPFVGFLHAERPARPSLALDMMEEFRPLLADRLAITLINRRQIGPKDFIEREGGAVELTKDGRKVVINAYQTRKQETLQHPLLEQECQVGHLMLVQARILARHLRGDISTYLPCVLR
ncbi:MAG: subtype I-C CRISPR-associated endonuclease Cas1 [Armatimonadota bacterium]